MDALGDLLPLLLIVPAAGAMLAAALGAGRAAAVRAVSLAVTVINLALAAVLAAGFAGAHAGPAAPSGGRFVPEFATAVPLLQVGARPSEAIQFFIGLDGLNVWLVVLTAFLMVPAVLVSWTAVRERANEYYAWLLALEAAMIGVFLAFDIVLFYVFFELTLVPLYFLIGIWGGPQRRYAARKFFIYTLAGSLITLLGVLGVVAACYAKERTLTFALPRLTQIVQDRLALNDPGERAFWAGVPSVRRIVGGLLGRLSPEDAAAAWGGVEFWVFLAMTAGFAIKVPLVPLHTWLPLAHVEAPTAGSVLLAGVLLKVGAYGFLRLCVPLAPDASLLLGGPLIGTLAVIGIVYGAFCALAQEDIKRLVAYSSVSHLGFCMLGMFALNATGLAGSLLQMINHGLSTGALFLLVGMLYERYHTRMLGDYGGMAARLRLLAVFMVFFCLTSVGLPGLNGFVGEVLCLMGMFDAEWARGHQPVLAVVGATGVVLGAWYLLTMLMRVFFGPVKEPAAGHGHGAHGPVGDLNGRELAALVPVALLCLALGVYPQPVLDASRGDIDRVAAIARGARDRAGEARPERPERPRRRARDAERATAPPSSLIPHPSSLGGLARE